MDADIAAQGTVLIPPADFPVSWLKPEWGSYHWTRDLEHIPDPILPMMYTASGVMAVASRERVAPIYEEAIAQRYDWLINNYLYTAVLPFQGSPEEMAARIRRNRERLISITLRLDEVWEKEWKPAIESHWAFWREFDLENAADEALQAHTEESVQRGAHLYEIHFRMAAPMWFALDEFVVFYRDLFPEKTELDAYRLLEGFDNKTMLIGRELWQLSRLARAAAPVYRVLTEEPTAQVCSSLAGFAEGRAFLAGLHRFLDTYGHRSNLWDWCRPSWHDDPTPVINSLKTYVVQPDRDLPAEQAAAVARREAAIAGAREALGGYPEPVVTRFEQLLKAAQIAQVLTEDHAYYTDFNGFGWIHRVFYEWGRRFTLAGRLNQPDDVFYLKLQELQAMMGDPTMDCRALTQQRRAEIAFWETYEEPRELGVRSEAPLYAYSPEARRTLRYLRLSITESAAETEAGNVLQGQAASSGKVRGRARVIQTLAEAYRLEKGDILVTATTGPSWTPLFLTVAGVVTDMGGVLSHSAIVSREYHLPAVVGTCRATERIQDGQWIEVDGDQGIVTLL